MSDRDFEIKEGTQIGEYIVKRRLGQGTFGVVYEAIQPVISKRAAIKVLARKFSVDPQMVSRFVTEARVVNQIGHKNIIDVFSFGALPDGRSYFIMEYLKGEPLDALLERRGKKLPIEEVIPILSGVAAALDAAHAAGVVHRDLKPANIFITRDEGQPFVKLLDFGIAKPLDEDAPTEHQTRTGVTMGTPGYMSPEQCRGDKVDQRTDIYALGVLANRLLTGRMPFGGTAFEILMKTTQETPPTLSAQDPSLPIALEAPVMAMLAKEPEERPTTAQEAFHELETVVEDTWKRASGSEADIETIDPTMPSNASGDTKADRGQIATTRTAAKASAQDRRGEPQKLALPQKPGRKAPPWKLAALGAVVLLAAGFVALRTGDRPQPLPQKAAKAEPKTVQPMPVAMKKVPAGAFYMGCAQRDRACDEDEVVDAKKVVGDFEIDETEVTVEAYARCVEAAACQEKGLSMPFWQEGEGALQAHPEWAHACNWRKPGREKHPINCVSWAHANDYCTWVQKRLPTEAEWEKAARGTSGQIYPWGAEGYDKLSVKVANIADLHFFEHYRRSYAHRSYDDGQLHSALVGSFPLGTSPYGALDMVGNVWEWTADWYSIGLHRAMRGGSYDAPAPMARASHRGKAPPQWRQDDVGFRCVR